MNSTTRLLVARNLIQRLNKRSRKGFTLIELLVVVVIIGILASVALPSFVGAQDKARNAGVQANINTIRMGLEQYGTDNNGAYPTALSGLKTNNYVPGNALPRSPWSKTPQTDSITVGGAALVAAADVASGASMPSIGAVIAAAGSVPSAAPAGSGEYGAIMYGLDNSSQTYVVYGTGKKTKAAIVAAEVSNGGN